MNGRGRNLLELGKSMKRFVEIGATPKSTPRTQRLDQQSVIKAALSRIVACVSSVKPWEIRTAVLSAFVWPRLSPCL